MSSMVPFLPVIKKSDLQLGGGGMVGRDAAAMKLLAIDSKCCHKRLMMPYMNIFSLSFVPARRSQHLSKSFGEGFLASLASPAAAPL